MYYFRVHNNTYNSCLLRLWVQTRMLHSTELHIWDCQIQHLIFPTDISVPGYPWPSCKLCVPILYLTVSQKVYARFQFFFQAFVINVSHYVCNINISSSQASLCSKFLPFKFSQTVKALKVLVTCFAIMNNPSSGFRVSLQCDKSVQLGTLLKTWYKKGLWMIQLNISSCFVQLFFFVICVPQFSQVMLSLRLWLRVSLICKIRIILKFTTKLNWNNK